MVKIRITSREIEIEGQIEKGRVTPFGTSAHIPFKKKHTGKVVSIVVSKNGKYIWLLNTQERKVLIESARKNIEKAGGKLRHYRLQLLEDLENKEFSIYSLIKVLRFVDNKELVNKIKGLYNLKSI